LFGQEVRFHMCFRLVQYWRDNELICWFSVDNQKGSDELWGDAGQDDITGESLVRVSFHLSAEQKTNVVFVGVITGGHNVLFGEDGSDTLHGGNDEDTLIGDNGRILRQGAPQENFPWDSKMLWVSFPAPFDSEAIRKVRLFDDVDKVEVCYSDDRQCCVCR
jgi:RTX calcium-binding nonapeptide repeat (4 copies)